MLKFWETNPFAVFEFRSRWRTDRAFYYLFANAAFLAFWVGMQVWLVSGPLDVNTTARDISMLPARYATLGHDMFVAFACTGIFCWLLLGPSLASGAIATERERGLLDGLLLSQLSPRDVLLGKLTATLPYAGCIFLSTIPIGALSLLFTGVSPAEFGKVIGLQAITAVFAASLSLAVSTVSLRSAHALRTSLSLITAWMLVTGGIYFLEQGWPALVPAVSGNWGDAARVQLFHALFIFGRTNPLLAVISVLDLQLTPAMVSRPWWLQPYGASLLFESVGTVLLIWWATRRFGRPLTEGEWMDLSDTTQFGTAKSARTVFWHLTALTRISFGNPILNRELRSKARFRRPSRLMLLTEISVATYLGYHGLRVAVEVWNSRAMRPDVWGIIVLLSIVTIVSYAGVAGGASIARERESGTWEGIGLALLTPKSVVRGKMHAVLFSSLALGLCFLPMALLCFRDVHWYVPKSAPDIVPARCLLAWVLNLVGASTLASALGIWISTLNKKASAATTWTLIALAVIWIGGPIFIDLMGGLPSSSESEAWMGLSHPLAAPLSGAFRNKDPEDFTSTGIPFSLLAVLAAMLMVRAAERAIAEDWRLREAHQLQ